MSGDSASVESRLKSTDETGRRRAILITGSASGIGLETARIFNSHGWFVVAVDNNATTSTDKATGRPRRGLDELKTEFGDANVHTAVVDVSKKDAFDALISELETILPERCGSSMAVLDVVFANAGIGRGGLWSEQAWQDHLDVVNINFVGVMVTIYSALKLMKGTPGGLVFSTSSCSAMYSMPGIATYSAAKHAVKGLTEALSIELGSFGIRVADTLPGTINTPLMPTASAEKASAAPEKSPFRLIEPAQVAECVWKSWVNDPDGKDALGDSTQDRIHWYVPEELQSDVDAVVNTRGGAEKIRGLYRETMWKQWEAAIQAAAAAKAADV
ncbi:NAD(P)-binding protein [Gonapodya prolifera JEL478]|uniref:NAD(P)-binding protein n=1 Tax=Gonapodya prolifera (strain JEL478) TaxID=1344416 RepID=A0A139ADB9_GONPJ|nr:NAD(P)-binding protein [Gonapodya prolifera JEL478]|eukprot:KXS14748.1 NAD(P)-binding protein [Gonapodya prolifera JEL478]